MNEEAVLCEVDKALGIVELAIQAIDAPTEARDARNAVRALRGARDLLEGILEA